MAIIIVTHTGIQTYSHGESVWLLRAIIFSSTRAYQSPDGFSFTALTLT